MFKRTPDLFNVKNRPKNEKVVAQAAMLVKPEFYIYQVPAPSPNLPEATLPEISANRPLRPLKETPR